MGTEAAYCRSKPLLIVSHFFIIHFDKIYLHEKIFFRLALRHFFLPVVPLNNHHDTCPFPPYVGVPFLAILPSPVPPNPIPVARTFVSCCNIFTICDISISNRTFYVGLGQICFYITSSLIGGDEDLDNCI